MNLLPLHLPCLDMANFWFSEIPGTSLRCKQKKQQGVQSNRTFCLVFLHLHTHIGTHANIPAQGPQKKPTGNSSPRLDLSIVPRMHSSTPTPLPTMSSLNVIMHSVHRTAAPSPCWIPPVWCRSCCATVCLRLGSQAHPASLSQDMADSCQLRKEKGQTWQMGLHKTGHNETAFLKVGVGGTVQQQGTDRK